MKTIVYCYFGYNLLNSTHVEFSNPFTLCAGVVKCWDLHCIIWGETAFKPIVGCKYGQRTVGVSTVPSKCDKRARGTFGRVSTVCVQFMMNMLLGQWLCEEFSHSPLIFLTICALLLRKATFDVVFFFNGWIICQKVCWTCVWTEKKLLWCGHFLFYPCSSCLHL